LGLDYIDTPVRGNKWGGAHGTGADLTYSFGGASSVYRDGYGNGEPLTGFGSLTSIQKVTAVSRSDLADGWRDRRADGGCVLDMDSGEVVVEGLSMPHSPRVHEGKLWLLNSGTGFLGTVDAKTGTFEPVTFCPEYLRGLCFVGDYAVAGLSMPRGNTFSGLALYDNLKTHDAEPRCGLVVIDTKTGDLAHWLRIKGVVEELYDDVALPGARRPSALGFRTDEVRRVLSVGGDGNI
jgi:uncharacterized protein (TIGR03032 family)